MRNYSRKFRRNYRRGGNPLSGLFSSDPQKAVEEAQANLTAAEQKLQEAKDKAAAAPPADAAGAEGESMTDKLKNMSPFSGGAPSNGVAEVSDSVKSGVNSLSSGIKSALPTFKGGRSNRRRSKKNSRRSNRRR